MLPRIVAPVLAFLLIGVSPWGGAADNSVRELPAATKNDQLFKTLCIGEKSTGFNWRDHEWNFTRFKPEKYLIEKLKPEKTAHTLLCWSEAQEKKRYENNDRALDSGCYSAREGEDSVGPARLCLEEWKMLNGAFVLQTVSCDEINFKPNGNFNAAQWKGATLDENASSNDSLSITVGRCSTTH